MNHEAALPMTLRLLLALLLTLTAPAMCTGAVQDDCRLVECPAPPACPADSRLQTASEEIDELEDYDELPTSDPFAGVRVEALGPIQRSTEPSHATSPGPNPASASTAPTSPPTTPPTTPAPRTRRELSFLHLALDEHAPTKGCCDEAACVCNECQPEALWPACAADEVAVELAAAQGTPGSCCATLVCVRRWACDGSLEAGAEAGAEEGVEGHSRDDYWKDACTRCRCFAGEELCEDRCNAPRPPHAQQQDEARGAGCYSDYLERLMPAGESWLEDAYCSECSCVDGEKACVTNLCAAAECAHPVKVEGRCCPVCVAEDTAHNATTVATTTAVPTTTAVDPSTAAEASSGEVAGSEEEATAETDTETEAMATAGSSTTEIVPEEGGETTTEPEPEAPEEDGLSEDGLSEAATSEGASSEAATSTAAATTPAPTSTATEAAEAASSTAASSTATEAPDTRSSESGCTSKPAESKEEATTTEFQPSSSAHPATESTTEGRSSTEASTSSPATTSAPWTPVHASSGPPSTVADVTSAPPYAPTSASAPTGPQPTTDAATPTSPTTWGPSEAPAPLAISYHRQHQPAPDEDASTATPSLGLDGHNMNRVEPLNSASPNMVRTTQQRVRRIFDEVDSVVVVVLALGSVLCLALGLVIRHSKNKKKIYSTIPSSETSLSQTSTNTVLTV